MSVGAARTKQVSRTCFSQPWGLRPKNTAGRGHMCAPDARVVTYCHVRRVSVQPFGLPDRNSRPAINAPSFQDRGQSANATVNASLG
eukprot:2223666-Pleurochrysis_carterae.AAC.1